MNLQGERLFSNLEREIYNYYQFDHSNEQIDRIKDLRKNILDTSPTIKDLIEIIEILNFSKSEARRFINILIYGVEYL